jgi:hypothetical protein
MSLTALEWGLRAPITPRFGGNLEALPRPQDTEPKQQQKTDLKHKESDRPAVADHHSLPTNSVNPVQSKKPPVTRYPQLFYHFSVKYFASFIHHQYHIR